MAVVIRKWGNSAAVRLPAAVLADAGVEIDQPVDVRVERGRIVIEPLRKKQFTLRELVDGITAENMHELTDTGPPVGKEVW